MPVDAGIFNALAAQPKSVEDYLSAYDQQDARKMALQQHTLAVQQTQATMADQARTRQESEGVRNLLAGHQGDFSTMPDALRRLGTQSAITQADALEKSILERMKTRSVVGKDDAEAAAKLADTKRKAYEHGIQWLQTAQTPEQARQMYDQGVQLGHWSMQQAQQQAQGVPNDPAEFNKWRVGQLRQIMAAKDQLPKLVETDQGGTRMFGAQDLFSGAMTKGTEVPITVSANTVATNARIASEGAASRAQSALQHAATIKKDLMVHGIMPDGSMDSNAELTAQAIAKGQLPPPTGMALLNPKNQRILGRVMEINPSYDFTDVTAKRAAATAFTTGKQGDALRFVSTANAHLDQMGDLVAAMENHDTKVINRVSNWYKEQTGKPAPTTFDAVKNIVGQEVVKAIVANGGTGTERDEAAKSFSRSNSPAQLTEIIRHYRMIMGAQADNLLAQRRAVGLSDKTLPKYNTTTQGGNTPANSVLDAADAILNRGK